MQPWTQDQVPALCEGIVASHLPHPVNETSHAVRRCPILMTPAAEDGKSTYTTEFFGDSKMWSFCCREGWIPGLRERNFQSVAALSSTLRRSQLYPVSGLSPLTAFLDGTSHLTGPRRPPCSAVMVISLYLAALFDWTFPWDIYVKTKENTPGSFLISANPS